MPATSTNRGPSLDFDPRYLEFMIEAWQARDLAPTPPDELVSQATERATERLTELNAMGMLEEDTSLPAVKKIFALLKSLGFTKEATTGPKGMKIKRLTVTSDGRAALTEPTATGGARPLLVSRLLAKSSQLTTLVRALHDDGPLVTPERDLAIGAPTRGAAYTRAMADGLASFRELIGLPATIAPTPPVASKGRARTTAPTPAQMLTAAKAAALKHHPIGNLTQAQLDKAIPTALGLGLLWTDSQRVNEVIAAQYVGAAVIPAGASYAPNTPTWAADGPSFVEALLKVQAERADSTGFATITALRGGLGQTLHIAPAVADALICEAREAGERHEASVDIHFEPDEELMYVKGRQPLLWLGHAFDFVDVHSLPLHTQADERIAAHAH